VEKVTDAESQFNLLRGQLMGETGVAEVDINAAFSTGVLPATADRSVWGRLDTRSAVDLSSIHIAAGVRVLNAGNVDGAVDEFSQAIQHAPGNVRAWNGRGYAHIAGVRGADAIADLTQALLLDPAFTPARINRGFVFLCNDQPQRALDDFTEAVAQASDCGAVVLHGRGLARAALGDFLAAIEDFTVALDLDRTLWRARHDRAVSQITTGEFRAAVRDLDIVLGQNPEYSSALFHRGVAHASAGDLSRALADYSETVRLTPEHALAWFHRADVHRAQGQIELAISDHSRAIESQPRLTSAWLNRAECYIE